MWGARDQNMEVSSMAQIVVILVVGPLLLGLSHYTASRILARNRWGPRGWRSQWLGRRGLEKRQSSWNSVYAGSQRWSLLGDSRLGVLGPLAQCALMARQARAKGTCISSPSANPKAHVETVTSVPFPQTAFERNHQL